MLLTLALLLTLEYSYLEQQGRASISLGRYGMKQDGMYRFRWEMRRQRPRQPMTDPGASRYLHLQQVVLMKLHLTDRVM